MGTWDKNNPAKVLAYKKKWRDNNRAKIRAYLSSERVKSRRNRLLQARRLNDATFRFVEATRSRINVALAESTEKWGSTNDLLGCSWDQFMGWLEIQFVSGMSWENYGEWHVDHIRPLARFNLTDFSQQLQAFNYKNTQPLWAKDNMQKGAKCQ